MSEPSLLASIDWYNFYRLSLLPGVPENQIRTRAEYEKALGRSGAAKRGWVTRRSAKWTKAVNLPDRVELIGEMYKKLPTRGHSPVYVKI